jgi:Tol biopolymer transport system component
MVILAGADVSPRRSTMTLSRRWSLPKWPPRGSTVSVERIGGSAVPWAVPAIARDSASERDDLDEADSHGFSIGRNAPIQEPGRTRRWGGLVRNIAIGSKLAIATTGLAACTRARGCCVGRRICASGELGRVAVVSEFHPSEIYLADRTGKHLSPSHQTTFSVAAGRRSRLTAAEWRSRASTQGGWSVYVMKVGGGALFDVTKAAGHREGLSGYADWSPDGTKLAFSQEFPDAVNILVYDFQQKTTLPSHSDGREHAPAVVAGRHEDRLLEQRLGRQLDLYTVNADGSGETRLTTQPGWEIEPSWSPDGRRLAYTAYPGGKADIFVDER